MAKYKIVGESGGREKELGTVEAGGVGHAVFEASKKWPGYKYKAKRIVEKADTAKPLNKGKKEIHVKKV